MWESKAQHVCSWVWQATSDWMCWDNSPSNPTYCSNLNKDITETVLCYSGLSSFLPPFLLPCFPQICIIPVKKIAEEHNCLPKPPCNEIKKLVAIIETCWIKYCCGGEGKEVEVDQLCRDTLELGITTPVQIHWADELKKESHLQTHRTWTYTAHSKNYK